VKKAIWKSEVDLLRLKVADTGKSLQSLKSLKSLKSLSRLDIGGRFGTENLVDQSIDHRLQIGATEINEGDNQHSGDKGGHDESAATVTAFIAGGD
jgi:hypothetical protein